MSRSKHDQDCLRRRVEHPWLCTCGMTDEAVSKLLRARKRWLGQSTTSTHEAD